MTFSAGAPKFQHARLSPTHKTRLICTRSAPTARTVTYIFRLAFLVAPARHQLFQLVQVDHQLFLVLQPQLLADDGQIAHRIDLALHVRYVGIVKPTYAGE